MKVSEAIDRLEVGDTVWVKATLDMINDKGRYVRVMPNASSVYLDGHDEISLTEPQAEKVEARLAEHWNEDMGDVLWWNFPVEEPPYCGTPLDEHFPKYKTHFSMIDMPNEIEKPKRWVVKNEEGRYFVAFSKYAKTPFEGVFSASVTNLVTFDDKSKAVAVATLVEGTVEEV